MVRRWLKSRSRLQLPHLSIADASGRVPWTVGFFHPYCNAGGGGERVLWIAIKALQLRYKNVRCVVYTGDTDATGDEILQKAEERFNIRLQHSVDFIFLHHRNWVEAKYYPHFTMLGQSLGSIALGWEALAKFVPDVFIDSMGYAFTYPLFKYLGGCRVGCYVHYPTISTDMLQRVSDRTRTYNNESYVSQSTLLTNLKVVYYTLFAWLYGFVGKRSQVVMVNSSWTFGHIKYLWNIRKRTSIVYPPCDTTEFLKLPLDVKQPGTEQSIVSIAQFRPEKDHALQLKSFHKFLSDKPKKEWSKFTLKLIGSCRNSEDSDRVHDLKELAKKLEISDNVQFLLNVSFSDLKQHLAEATIGLHTMWNEHFGIGVVEIMAAGTIILAHKSGGPKKDIVVEFGGSPTGFLADSVDTYAEAMDTIFKLSPSEQLEICENARQSIVKFSEEEFEQKFLLATQMLFPNSICE